MPTIQNATQQSISEKEVRDLLDISQGLGEAIDLLDKSHKQDLKLVGEGESLHLAQQVASERLEKIACGLYNRLYGLFEYALKAS